MALAEVISEATFLHPSCWMLDGVVVQQNLSYGMV